MSFRKRNVGLTGPSISPLSPSTSAPTQTAAPGIRPSPLDGRPTTSTGTQSLDDLLGGHAGLPLGNSLLIEENGTTDFAGALLRFYAAEGLVQGHQVLVVGVGEQWGRELPGLAVADGGTKDEKNRKKKNDVEGGDREKMKIAWRYERLGEFGAGSRAPPPPTRTPPPLSHSPYQPPPTPFTHTFDLTKRLLPPPQNPITYIPLPPPHPSHQSPYTPILTTLLKSLTTHPTTPHRLLLPSLLLPPIYPSTSAPSPSTLLPFLHSLRALLRTHPKTLTALLSLPLPLHPRQTGLTKWIEHLSDGVIELAPFPYNHASLVGVVPPETMARGGGERGKEERMQGLVRVHKVPVFSEKGCGSGEGAEDRAFRVGRRRVEILPFWLPPVEGEEGGNGVGEGKEGLEF